MIFLWYILYVLIFSKLTYWHSFDQGVLINLPKVHKLNIFGRNLPAEYM